MAFAAAKIDGVDIIVASEPNKTVLKGSRWLKDANCDVGVLIVNRRVEIKKVHRASGYMIVDLGDCLLACCYASPNRGLGAFKTYLDGLMRELDKWPGEKIILGDLNAKSPQWGSQVLDRRGEHLCEWLAARNMVVHNTGLTPTWTRGDQASYIDITCSSQGVAGRISGWKVMEEESLSDHKFISFNIRSSNIKGGSKGVLKPMMNRVTFAAELGLALEAGHDLEYTHEDLTARIKRAYKKSLIKRNFDVAKLPYWWSEDIESARTAAVVARRRLTRHRARIDTDVVKRELHQAYKEAKTTLGKMIRAAKRQHWLALCEELNEDIWGSGYKITMKRLKGTDTPYELPEDKRVEIARQLFPRVDDPWMKEDYGLLVIPPFTAEEIDNAIRNMKTGKSPGPDGIPAEALLEVHKLSPEIIRGIMNNLAREGKFPENWKVARLVLVWKGKIPFDSASSQRPICLINTLGKLYETLIRDRLAISIDEGEGLADRQYGFRRGKSTIQAVELIRNFVKNTRHKLCALIAIDIRNAFNTAAWSIIISELQRRGVEAYLIKIVEDYFAARKIEVAGEYIDMTTGVPQGSVLGPTLWNVMYDGVLRLALPASVVSLAFADDLAILVSADDRDALERRTNEALREVDTWLITHKLSLAPEKTEAILLKGHRNKQEIKFKVQNEEIRPGRKLKYLGVMLDVQGTFGEHVRMACDKAESRAAALSRLLPNIRGPGSTKRLLLYNVVQSILLYAAPVWFGAMRIKRYKNMMEKAQRRMLLRVACAYRTVSTRALQVITGTPPIELLVAERRNVHCAAEGQQPLETKSLQRVITIRDWQELWNEENVVAQWTKRLIPQLDVWLKCNFKEIDYFTAQVLTGHGSFKQYTKRIGKTADAVCVYCGEEEDTVEHTIFACPRWEEERRQAATNVGNHISVENLVPIMVTKREDWRTMRNMFKNIMSKKEVDERAQQ